MRCRECVLTTSVILLACSVAVAQLRQTAKGPETVPGIQVDVDLTLVNATVSDGSNATISGLESKHFQVWEDKVEQKIEYFSSEERPVSIGVIFDVSGSMQEKIAAARRAVAAFLEASNSQDEFFLVQFNDHAELAEPFTRDISKLQTQLIFNRTKGMTAIYDAVYLGLETLKESGNAKKALLLVTDGEDNYSRYRESDIKQLVQERDVQIFAIGIAPDIHGGGLSGRLIIQELSDISGGKAFFPTSVYDLKDICEKIASELKNQYVLGYRSTNQARDGKFRKIRLKVTPPAGTPHVVVHARSGYYAPALQTAK